jgi:general secretion pathway protein J
MTRGFTLLELLVAMFITALMLALGYGALTEVIRQRASVSDQQQQLAQLQRAVRTLVQDFAQLSARPVRDVLGRGVEPALRADRRGTELVALTRGGRIIPPGTQQPTLQRIEYELRDEALVRRVWPALERTQSSTPRQRVLLRGVRSDEPQRSRSRPRAVEITLDTLQFGKIVRLVEVAG